MNNEKKIADILSEKLPAEYDEPGNSLDLRNSKAAQYYAGRGWKILPLRPRTKKPHLKWAEATTDLKKIEEWWDENSEDGPGVLGSSVDFWILDEDGDEGKKCVAELE